jgi:hypothetical protein
MSRSERFIAPTAEELARMQLAVEAANQGFCASGLRSWFTALSCILN